MHWYIYHFSFDLKKHIILIMLLFIECWITMTPNKDESNEYKCKTHHQKYIKQTRMLTLGHNNVQQN